MAPPWHSRLAAYFLLIRLSVAFFDDAEDEEYLNRHPPPRCPKFECPAFTRPVQRDGFKVWAYNTCDRSRPHYVPEVEDEQKARGIDMVVDRCCMDRDICAKTCGMQLVECHEHFHKCMKHFCHGDKDCKNTGDTFAWNSWSHLEDRCEYWKESQEAACDCVPSEKFDTSLKDRLIGFYKLYNKEKLNKKNDLKDKDLWKKYKGKRPQMFFELHQKYRAEAVEPRERKNQPPKGFRPHRGTNPQEL